MNTGKTSDKESLQAAIYFWREAGKLAAKDGGPVGDAITALRIKAVKMAQREAATN